MSVLKSASVLMDPGRAVMEPLLYPTTIRTLKVRNTVITFTARLCLQRSHVHSVQFVFLSMSFSFCSFLPLPSERPGSQRCLAGESEMCCGCWWAALLRSSSFIIGLRGGVYDFHTGQTVRRRWMESGHGLGIGSKTANGFVFMEENESKELLI